MRQTNLGRASIIAAALGITAAPAFAEQQAEEPTTDASAVEQGFEDDGTAFDDELVLDTSEEEVAANTTTEQNEATSDTAADEDTTEGAELAADTDADNNTEDSADEDTTSDDGTLVIRGADPSISIVAELADAFAEQTGQTVALEGGASSEGPAATLANGADLTFAARTLTDEETATDLQQFPFGFDGIAVITSPGATNGNLSTQELREIFSGQAASWNNGEAITAFAEQSAFGSGTAFADQVLDGEPFADTVTQTTPRTILERVASEPGAIGFISASSLPDDLTGFELVDVDEVSLSDETVASQAYPLRRTFTLVTSGQPTGTTDAFVRFVQSQDGRQMLVDAGFIAAPAGDDAMRTASVETDQASE